MAREATIRQRLKFAPGIIDPREITDYRGFLLQRVTSPPTVRRRLISLRRYFAWAKKQRMLSESPFEMLERVRVKEQKDVAPCWLSRKEQLALLRAARQGENQRDLEQAVQSAAEDIVDE